MFHTSHIHVPRNNRPSALRTFVTSSSFGSAETKEPLRRGILFTTVASVLLLVGSILTWLGFNDVFGGKVSMTGPLLIALALLLLLLSMRQFLIARKRNNSTRNGLQLGQMGRGTVTAVVVDRNDGVGAVTVVMDSHSIDQGPHFRNSASSTLEDYEPPSYGEVTRCFPGSTPTCQPVVCQDEPPPPYEEAVVGDGSRSTGLSQTEELAPAYSPQGRSGYSIDRGSTMMAIPGQVPGPQCYHCCMFPRSTGLDATSGSRLTTHSLSAGQVLGTQELAPSMNRSWSTPRRFVLIPHFLGIFANGSTDPAHSMTGELPPAYQAVDTTGRSPLTYVQAMGLSNPQSGQDHLGIQSPHESRATAMQEQMVDTYHPSRSKDNVSPGVVPISNLPQTGSNEQSSTHISSQPGSNVLASSSLVQDTPNPSGNVTSLPSSSLPGSVTPSYSQSGAGPCSTGSTVQGAFPDAHISTQSHAGLNIPGCVVSTSCHHNSTIPGSSSIVYSNTSSTSHTGDCHLRHHNSTGNCQTRARADYTPTPRSLLAPHGSSSPIVDELEDL